VAHEAVACHVVEVQEDEVKVQFGRGAFDVGLSEVYRAKLWALGQAANLFDDVREVDGRDLVQRFSRLEVASLRAVIEDEHAIVVDHGGE